MGDVLFLAHRSPWPPDRGDKIRAYHILKHLSATRQVHLIAFADDRRDLKEKAALVALSATRALVWRAKSRARATLEALVGGRPASLTAFDSRAMRARVADILQRRSIDTIYVFSSQMAQYLPSATRARVIMDFCDVDSLKFAAYAKASYGPMRWLLMREARLLRQFEQSVANWVDASVFVSEPEAELFRARSRACNVHVIENGIDSEFFNPNASFRAHTAASKQIVFTGQMDYRPNIEAAQWFAQEILPRIRRVHPDATFAIVGRNPAGVVHDLGRRSGVIVTGEVDDVRGWLAGAACVVAPLRQARGVQNKVLEAMAMARPVVASGCAAQGIDHAGTILSGDTEDEIARAVIGLLSDADQATALGKRARARVQVRYTWSARLEPLDRLLAAPHRHGALRTNAVA